MNGKFTHKIFLLALLALFLGNGNRAYSQKTRSLDESLQLAGTNSKQLKIAIEKCSGTDLGKTSIRFLIRNMPSADLKSLSADFLVKNIEVAIQARQASEWAKRVPLEVFLNDVLPYASINERRDDWRSDFHSRFQHLVKDCKTTGEAAQALNKNVFQLLKVRYSTQRKKADQSPYESMETGLASCTGLSVILTDACRSVGVPARLAGTPLWVNKRGNHTWVEVWDEGEWKFTGACEYDANGLNRGWFKGIASQADPTNPLHRIYATSFRQTDIHFPMVWKRNSREVPGIDVTWKYTGKTKPRSPGESTVAFQLYNRAGERIATEVRISRENRFIGSGKSRDDSNDANDYFEINLKPGKYNMEFTWDGKKRTKVFEVAKKDQQIIKAFVD